MQSVAAVMTKLKGLGTEQTRKIYVRHGAVPKKVLGVSVADMKATEKSIRKELGKGHEAERQRLALGLYATGIYDAMYLAGMLADGAKMTVDELRAWARGSGGMSMIAEYTVPWVAVENAAGRELALEWIGRGGEFVAASGWCTYSGLLSTKPDAELDLHEIKALLKRVTEGIHKAANRERYTMNGFVIAVGSYVRPLEKEAKAAATKIGAVSVEMGETACKVPDAAAYIAKTEAAGKAGVKKKTIRC